jgi:hypothetical protein
MTAGDNARLHATPGTDRSRHAVPFIQPGRGGRRWLAPLAIAATVALLASVAEQTTGSAPGRCLVRGRGYRCAAIGATTVRNEANFALASG